MREILFKAWCKEGKGFINGFNMVGFSTGSGAPAKKLQRFSNEWCLDEVEILQYTEFDDDSKKPIKIFDGDVLQGSWQESTGEGRSETLWVNGVVSWDSENGKWIVTEIPSLETYDLADWMPERKVIGNKYSNPELLERQHD